MKKLVFIIIITILISYVTSRRAVRSKIYHKSNYETIIDSIRGHDSIIPPLDSLLCSRYFSSGNTAYMEYLYHKMTDTSNYILVIGKDSNESVYVIEYRVE